MIINEIEKKRLEKLMKNPFERKVIFAMRDMGIKELNVKKRTSKFFGIEDLRNIREAKLSVLALHESWKSQQAAIQALQELYGKE